MKIKHQHIEIPNDGSDPFVNCKLERKQYAKVLTGIVQNYAEGFVLAIDNNWGTGKTTFIKMWRQELTNERFETLYFNAWENDFQEEVIIALLSELQELKPDKGRTFDSLLEKTATFMKKVGPAVIKGAVSKALGDDATADIATAVMEYTSEQVEEQLFAFNEKKKGIQDFRNILEKYVDEIDDEKPVVFFIDELDRCRPSYSVEVLEQIKHLFSVPGIVFVLSVDKVQLGNAVRGFYGSDLINADEYLRRFIDLEYNIPSPSYQKFFSYLYAYFDFDSFLSSKERLTYPNLQDDKHRFLKFASRLFHHSKLSLRQIEKVMSQIRIGLLSFKVNQYFMPELFLLLIYLKRFDNQLYKDLKSKKLSLQDLTDAYEKLIKKLVGNNFTDEEHNFYIFLEVLLLTGYESYFEYNPKIQLVGLNSDGEKELKVRPAFDNSENYTHFLNVLNNFSRQYRSGAVSLKHLIAKIELLDKIEN